MNSLSKFYKFRMGVPYTGCGASKSSVTVTLHQQHKFFHPYFYTLWEIWIKYGVERGTRCRSWLRHCATRRKVACSLRDGVIGIFHWPNPSVRTVALESTQRLTEKSTRDISWGYRWTMGRFGDVATFLCRLYRNSGSLKMRSLSWRVTPLQGGKFPVNRLSESYTLLRTT